VNDLLTGHDVLLADLDGTLYRGKAAIAGAVEAVADAATRGVRTVYITNNAAHGPAEVAAKLVKLGFAADADDVATSAQAGAAMLAAKLPAAAPVLVVGTEALADEVRAVGLTVTGKAAEAAAVIQGHGPETAWPLLAEATVALRAGAVWVACNLDVTLPSERGPLPGNGAMVAALRAATGRTPEVAGKPAPELLRDAMRRAEARSALMVGDRLDTDVEGGRAAAVPTLLVLTGVADATQVLAAPPAHRPDHIGADMGALRRCAADLTPGPRPGWTVRPTGSEMLELAATATHPDPLDALLALCGEHWERGGGPVRVTAADAVAEAALNALGLVGADDVSATVAGADS